MWCLLLCCAGEVSRGWLGRSACWLGVLIRGAARLEKVTALCVRGVCIRAGSLLTKCAIVYRIGASRKGEGLRLLADDRSSPTGVSEDRIEKRGEKRHKVT